MEKQHILDEIKRSAAANGGSPLGRDGFTSATGIRKSDWYGVHWSKWGDALKEAGFEPLKLSDAFSEAELLDALFPFVREIGHIPSEGEMRIRTRRGDGFPHAVTLRRLGNRNEVAIKMLAHLLGREGFEDVVAICEPLAQAPIRVRKSNNESNTMDGYVYLISSGKRYKIGATGDLGTRSKAIGVQMPDPTKTEHVIRTDDPFGIKRYWHERFKAKRMNGEWFDLSHAEVLMFKRRKTM